MDVNWKQTKWHLCIHFACTCVQFTSWSNRIKTYIKFESHTIPIELIFWYYTWSQTTCRVIFSTLKDPRYPILMTFIFYNAGGADIHVGSFFNVKIWAHPIPMKFIYCNYTWSKITCMVINLTLSNSNAVYISLLHVEQKGKRPIR